MSQIMMQLGLFQFKLNTAAYQKLSESYAYDWAEVFRIGTTPKLQFTGKKAPQIDLEGVNFPHWRGGKNQLDYIRLQAELGEPLVLVSGSVGSDNLFGRWVVVSLTNESSVFFNDGSPRKQSWKLSLKQYDEGLLEALSEATGVLQNGLTYPKGVLS